MKRLASLSALVALAASLPSAPAFALDLERALAEAADANPTLAARQAEVDAARRRVGPAGAWSSPMLELGVVNIPKSGNFDEDPMTMKMVGLSQRVSISGVHGLHRRSAREAVQAAAGNAEIAHWEVLAMTWQAYADAYYAGERAAHAEVHVGVMDRMVQSARARYGSGKGRLEETLQAEAERARTMADGATFRAEDVAARARLDALRGVTPGENGPLEPLPAMADSNVAGILSPADHPRLRALDAQVARYRHAARASRRMVWPDLEVKWSWGIRVDEIPGGSLHGLPVGAIRQKDLYTTTVGIMLPIFAGSRELAEGAEMDAMGRAAAAERRGAELEVRGDIAAARAAVSAASRTVSLLADTVVTAQSRALEASLSAYAAGTTDLWRALDSSHALYDQTLALSRARQDLEHARARLMAVSAGKNASGLRLPPPDRSRP